MQRIYVYHIDKEVNNTMQFAMNHKIEIDDVRASRYNKLCLRVPEDKLSTFKDQFHDEYLLIDTTWEIN